MRIYLFRGLFGGVFSRGMDTLAEKLSSQGHVTSVHRWMERELVQEQVLAGGSSAQQTIALIGHSLGGNSANYMGNDLTDAGLDVAYVATIDATGPRPAPDGVTSDNFRSSDWRDKPVPGANEFNFPELNHIQIDKDDRVHQQILDRCGADTKPGPVSGSNGTTGEMQMANDDTRASGVSDAGKSQDPNAALAQALTALLAALTSSGASAAIQPGVVVPPQKESELTPINGWLGQGLGKMLNGKKTGMGLVGMLSIYLLPALFPQLAPIQAIFQSLGATSPELVGSVAGDHETGKSILTPIFAALGGWGVLGKVEKWVTGIGK